MKGIIFTAESVRAIEAGRKTQTRRIIPTDTRPQSANTFMRGFPPNPVNVRMCGPYAKCDAPPGSHSVSYRVKPRYTVGKIVYVKETWAQIQNDGEPPYIEYRADTGNPLPGEWPEKEMTPLRWKSPLHMPQWAARHFLRIESVRAERLQDISEEDARAEGVTLRVQTGPTTLLCRPWATEYRLLWDSLDGRRPGCSWAENPFCWVYSLRRVER